MADKQYNLYISGFSGLTHSDISTLIDKTLTAGQQTVVSDLITSIELFLCHQTNRQFHTTHTYYETFNAGKYRYIPKNTPIKEVTKILLDSATKYEKDGESNTLTLGIDFFVYPNEIVFETLLSSGVNNRRALVIYHTIEAFWGEDVKLAIKRMVADLFLSSEYGTKPITNLSISGGLSMGFDNKAIPDFFQKIINQYRIHNV